MCVVIIVIAVIIYIIYNNSNNEDYSFFEDENIISNNISEISNIIEYSSIEYIEEEIVVHIIGQVVNEGIVKLKEGSRVIDAIEKAGGATEEADLSLINLAYILQDGEKIYIPSVNDKEEMEVLEYTGTSSESKKELKININTAKQAELEKLPGIGESIASKIIDYRNKNGKFSSIEELKNVSGIGESKYNNIKNYVYVK